MRAVLGVGDARRESRIDVRWTWHHRALLSLRERLLKEREERLGEVSQALEPRRMDAADSATDEFDQDLALSELSAEQDALYEVEAALKRILDGTYGVCEATGRPIPAARLKAVPWTRFIREVEARLEKNGAIAGPHLGQINSVRGRTPGSLEDAESVENEAEASVANDEALEHVFVPSGGSKLHRARARIARNPKPNPS